MLRLVTLQVHAPPDMAELRDEDALADLRDAAARLGAETEALQASNLGDLRAALQRVPALSSRGEVLILVVSAHGKRVSPSSRSPGGSHHSFLLPADTEHHDLPGSAVNLDTAVQDLAASARGPLLVVVDACEVEVREARGDAAVAVLLANPGGSAEMGERGPVLTRCLARTLREAHRRPRTLRAVVERVEQAVQDETANRQRPRLAVLGRTGFLDEDLPSSEETAHDGLIPALLEMTLQDQLPVAAARILLRAHGERGSADPGTRLVLLASILRSLSDAAVARELEQQIRHGEGVACRPALARAKHILGWWRAISAVHAPEWTRAEALLSEALQLVLESRGEPQQTEERTLDRLEAQILDTLGTVQQSRLNWREAIENHHRSIERKRTLGDALGLEMTRGNLGWAFMASGRFLDAERVFEEGVSLGLDRLHVGQGTEAAMTLVQAVDAVAFHAHGLFIARLILGARADVFRRQRSSIDPMTRLQDRMARWGGRAPYPLVHLLGIAGMSETPGQFPVDGGVPADDLKPWAHAAAFCRGDSGAYKALVEVLVGAAGASKPKARMNALAVASYLFHRIRTEKSVEALSRVLDRMRELDRSIDPISAWPWSVGAERVRVATEAWPDWGPLGALRSEAAHDTVVFHPSVTEQYLQIFAWCSGLRLCMAGGIPAAVAVGLLSKCASKGAPFQLTLKQAFVFLRQVADQAKGRSDWCRRWKEAWIGAEPLKAAGYDGPEGLGSERNDFAHHLPMTLADAREIVDRHQDLIRRMADLWRQAPEVSLYAGPETVGDSAMLRSAVLTDERGQTYDCGLLLAVPGAGPSVCYVPHLIDHVVLEGSAGGSVSYLSYGRSVGRDIEGSIKVKVCGGRG